MRQTDIVIAGGGLAGSAAAAMLGRAGYGVVLVDPHESYPPDFRAEKIDGTQARILARTGLADAVLRAATLRRRKLGRALRPPRREAPGRPARHSVSHAGQHDPGRDSAERHVHPRQGDGHRHERAAPARHALDRRRDFRASRHRGERAQRRPAPQTGHGAPGREQDAFDHARLRSRAGGARELPVSGADLLRRAARRPHRLHHAVSDWRDDAREPVRLSRDGRSVAARVPPASARDLDGADAGAGGDHRRVRRGGARTGSCADPPGRSLCDDAASCSPASCWWAMRSRPHVRRPAPAPGKCSPTSSGCATCTSRAGLRAPAWARTRSRRSTTIRSSATTTRIRPKRRFTCARSPSSRGSPGRRGGLCALRRGSRSARRGRRARGGSRGTEFAIQGEGRAARRPVP